MFLSEVKNLQKKSNMVCNMKTSSYYKDNRNYKHNKI